MSSPTAFHDARSRSATDAAGETITEGALATATFLIRRWAIVARLLPVLVGAATVASHEPHWIWLPLLGLVAACLPLEPGRDARRDRGALVAQTAVAVVAALAPGPAAPLILLPAVSVGIELSIVSLGSRLDAVPPLRGVWVSLGFLPAILVLADMADASAYSIIVAGLSVVCLSLPGVWAAAVEANDLDDLVESTIRPAAAARASGRLHDPIRHAERALEDFAERSEVISEAASRQLLQNAEEIGAILDEVTQMWSEYDHPQIRAGIPARIRTTLGSSLRRMFRPWSTQEAVPAWWPRAMRAAWLRTVAPWLDTVRIIHTRQIEAVALNVTLWLRAVTVLSVPTIGSALLGGVTPDGDPLRTIVWIALAAAASITALGAVPLVDRVMDADRARFRRNLFLVEETLVLTALIVIPSWAVFVFSGGPQNWLQRPDWRMRRALTPLLLHLSVMSVSLNFHGASARSIALQCTVGLVVLLLTSNSYGLMIPFVIYAAIGRPFIAHSRRERLEETLVDPRVDRALRIIDDAESTIRAEALRLGTEDADHATSAMVEQLRVARSAVHDAAEPRQRSLPARTLSVILHEAIRTHIAATSTETSAYIQATAVHFAPPSLGARRVRSRALAQHLGDAMRTISAEASVHGIGLFQVRCTEDDGRISILAANDVDSSSAPDPGGAVGRRALQEAISDLPGGSIVWRGLTDGRIVGESETIPVFAVEFAFSSSILQPERVAR